MKESILNKNFVFYKIARRGDRGRGRERRRKRKREQKKTDVCHPPDDNASNVKNKVKQCF